MLGSDIKVGSMPYSYLKSDSSRFVYFVTAKCACSSIKRTLLPLLLGDTYSEFESVIQQPNFDVHDFVRTQEDTVFLNKQKLEDMFSAGDLDEYFKFGFVRNPWDRLVSCYESKVSSAGKKLENRGQYPLKIGGGYESTVHRGMGFSDFARAIAQIPDEYANVHFISQYPIFYRSEDYTELMCDSIGRFEVLSENFERIMAIVDPNHTLLLPRLNVSRKTKESYRHYYNDELRDLIAERYAEDIRRFEYDF
jgi:hypothetical protein